jgi:hypothetical protein
VLRSTKVLHLQKEQQYFFPREIPTQIDIKKVGTLSFSWAREDDQKSKIEE